LLRGHKQWPLLSGRRVTYHRERHRGGQKERRPLGPVNSGSSRTDSSRSNNGSHLDPMMRSTVRSFGRFLPVQASMRFLIPAWSTAVNTSSWVRVGTASWTSSAETISSPLPLNDLSDGRRVYDPQKLHLTRKVGSVIPDTYRLSQPPKRG
jgi:hypothetical protein